MNIYLSRSEVKTEVEKAVRGSGFDWGRAKDSGVMAVWLAAHGQFFLGNILRFLDEADSDQQQDAAAKFGPIDGILLSEYVLATGLAWSGKVIGTRFLIAAMGIVSHEQQTSLILSNDNDVIAYAENGATHIDQESIFYDANITLQVGHLKNMPDTFSHLKCSDETAHPVSETCWMRLNAFAWKVYVPETEEKRRSGAGAGDIDNS